MKAVFRVRAAAERWRQKLPVILHADGVDKVCERKAAFAEVELPGFVCREPFAIGEGGGLVQTSGGQQILSFVEGALVATFGIVRGIERCDTAKIGVSAIQRLQIGGDEPSVPVVAVKEIDTESLEGAHKLYDRTGEEHGYGGA